MADKARRKIIEAMEAGLNQEWVMEGLFPIPLPNGQIAYSPAKGKLVEVFEDGFALMEKDDVKATLYLFSGVRSVTPYQDTPSRGGSRIVKPTN